MDKWETFHSAQSLATEVGSTGRQLSSSEVAELSEAVSTVWGTINPHNAMELLALISQKVGPQNAAVFLESAIPMLRKQPSYDHEARKNSAARCLVAAALTSDRPDLLGPEIIESQAKYLASYTEENSSYSSGELAVMRKHISSLVK